jgi:hypothetical protein
MAVWGGAQEHSIQILLFHLLFANSHVKKRRATGL